MRPQDQVTMFLFLGLMAVTALIGNYILIRFQDSVDKERHADIKKRAEEAKKNWKKAHFDRKVSAIQTKKQTKKIDG